MDAPHRPQHTRSSPVFVLGCTGSGTSLTCRLLLDHLGVNFGTESQFIVRYSRLLPRYGDLRVRKNMRRLLADISRERFFSRTRRNFGFVFDLERALHDVPEPTYAGALRAIFEQFAAGRGMARWGDKTPEYNYHLDVLLRLFPTAQFVHVVRDPRDIAVSHFKAAFGAKTAYEAATLWCDTLTRVRRFAARLGPDQFVEFRYEDLLHDPPRTLARVASFLGIPDPSSLVAGIADRLRVQVKSGNSNKWHSLLCRELECIETVAGPRMAELGYVRATAGMARIGRLERARWRAQGIWRRAADRRYWADSIYRLALRAHVAPLLPRQLARS